MEDLDDKQFQDLGTQVDGKQEKILTMLLIPEENGEKGGEVMEVTTTIREAAVGIQVEGMTTTTTKFAVFDQGKIEEYLEMKVLTKKMMFVVYTQDRNHAAVEEETLRWIC